MTDRLALAEQEEMDRFVREMKGDPEYIRLRIRAEQIDAECAALRAKSAALRTQEQSR